MLNVGQVVYDETNKRVIIFAGCKMLHNKKTGKCRAGSGLILPDGSFLRFKGNNADNGKIKHTNLNLGGRPFLGSFVDKCKCRGHFFGIINGNDEKVKIWAKETIEEVEALIAERGLNTEECQSSKGTYTRYHIGPVLKLK